jgi:hypothetical protein
MRTSQSISGNSCAVGGSRCARLVRMWDARDSRMTRSSPSSTSSRGPLSSPVMTGSTSAPSATRPTVWFYLAVSQYEVASIVRRFLHHPVFATHAQRRGTVVRASRIALHRWRLHQTTEEEVQWLALARKASGGDNSVHCITCWYRGQDHTGIDTACRPMYSGDTSSVSRATAPERKARRRRHPPGAHWRATAGGGHGEWAAMPLEDVAQPLGSSPGGEEMGRGPPARDRRRDVRMSTVQAGNPDPVGQVYEDAPAGKRPHVSLRGPRQPQDWWRPFVFVGEFFHLEQTYHGRVVTMRRPNSGARQGARTGASRPAWPRPAPRRRAAPAR